MIYTVEGNTSSASGVVANGGGVATKSYDTNNSRIKEIIRPNYKDNEAYLVTQEALKWVGYLEKKSNSNLESFTDNAGYNNYNIFAEHAHEVTGSNVFMNGAYWCVYYIEDVMIRALGINRAKELLGEWTGVCSGMSKGARNQGGTKVDKTEARYGDFILFYNSNKTDYAHIGLVTNGYEKPKATSTSTDTNTNTDKKEDYEYMKTIKRGSKGKTVGIWQVIVGCTPDKDFGATTEKYTKGFQQTHGLVVDGIVGEKTWEAGLKTL